MSDFTDSPTPAAGGVSDALLDRFLAGECTADEAMRVERAFDAHPDEARIVHAIVDQVAGLDRAVTEAAEALRAFHAANARRRVGAPFAPGRVNTGRLGPSSIARRWGAGVAIGAAGLAALVVWHGRAPAAEGVTRTYATRTGQQAVLTLDDGTRVTLAPRTTLVLRNFGGTARPVELDGEAYFEVPRAAGAPFVVLTDNVSTRVLGTAFLVRHYLGDSRVRVVVASGKVSVAAAGARRPALTLVAGYTGEVGDSGVTATATDDMSPYTGWIDGRLVFQGATGAEVLATLTRWYGYEFRVDDPAIERQKITIGLSTRSAAEALATVKLLFDVDLAFDGNVVTLRSRHAHATPPRPRQGAGEDLIPFAHEVGR